MRSQFPDAPYSLSDPAIAAERQELLGSSHMTLLNAFVEGKRREISKGMPYFDPLDAGESARLLIVLESPGPKAVGSNFVSRNNPDPTARNTFEALHATGLSRSLTSLWNTVPWNVSTATKNNSLTKAEVSAGIQLLLEVMKLMPNLVCVVLCGRQAWLAADCIEKKTAVPVIRTYHFSNRSFGHAALRQHILASLGAALELLNGQRAEIPALPNRSWTSKQSKQSSVRESSYTVELHRDRCDLRRRSIFDKLRSRILELHLAVREKAVKILVGYRYNLNFAEIHFLSDRLKIHLRPRDYVDPRGFVEWLPNPGFTMDRRFYLSDESDLDYATGLIRQSFTDVADR